MDRSRRRVLATGAAGIAALSAGCLAGRPACATSGAPRAQASFYLLYDLARNVAGDEVAVESVVPFGQHGHGWDGPTAGQHRDILTSDLFVYMGKGFQPWADDVVETIRDDGADVAIVSAREHIDLLDAEHDHGEGDSGDEHATGEHHEGTEHGDHEDHESAGEAGDHDHGADGHDPHFWLDPRRTGRAVRNIRDAVLSVAPGSEPAVREGTDAYVRDLDDLHAEFEGALADAEREAVFVAGHNAFRYLGHAYGFETFGLTGVSPDEGISASARREAEAVIEEHAIEYVLHPVMEPRAPAEQLVADTGAEGVLDVTAISGVTDDWVEADLGYLELMRSINLPAFTTALGGG